MKKKPTIKKEPLPQYGKNVYMVDGTFIRNHINADFVGGGLHAIENYIPEGEIWIEKGASESSIEMELSRVLEMMSNGMSYEKAHSIAIGKEKK